MAGPRHGTKFLTDIWGHSVTERLESRDSGQQESCTQVYFHFGLPSSLEFSLSKKKKF